MFFRSMDQQWAGGKRQPCVTRSSTEADLEYVALSHATQEIVWLRRLLNDIGEKQDQPSIMNKIIQGKPDRIIQESTIPQSYETHTVL